MNILVTGGAGYIGSHTCVLLLENGYDITVMDNFSNSSMEAVKAVGDITGKTFPFYETDLLDPEGVNRIFAENKIDAVIHFAGLKAVGESVEKPLEYYHNNITGTLNLLASMRTYGVKKLVFSSSATVYGMNNPIPFEETMPTSATNPYGWTKVMIEQIITDYVKSAPGTKAALLRYFNPIGAHKSGLIGEQPNGIPNNLMPYICQVAVGRLSCLNVFGNDYDTVDGTGVRDYLHVCDLAEGHIRALEAMDHFEGARIYNLGTGKGTSVLELVHAFEEASGIKINYRIAPRRAGDIAECYANAERAEKELGWKAKYGIQEMCADSWNFIKDKYR